LLFWFCGLGLLGLGGKVCEMSGSKRWLMGLDKKLFHRKISPNIVMTLNYFCCIQPIFINLSLCHSLWAVSKIEGSSVRLFLYLK
jgi:hypothetical protein